MSQNLTGRYFGRWRVEGRADGLRAGTSTWWHCVCHCGNRSVVNTGNLVGGFSRSCGCGKQTQGGKSTSREYKIWQGMIARCHNSRNTNFRFYGARGTYVCARWRESFVAFLEDVGVAPSERHTLDRKNTLGSYTCGKCDHCRSIGVPANYKWATKAEQVRNQKNNRFYTHDGKTLILKDWARLAGVPYVTLWNRLNRGVAFADAIQMKRYDRKGQKAKRPKP